MSASIERFDERARREADRVGETLVHRGELLRHPVYTRVLHWSVAIFFVLALLSGFALYTPWLYRWLTPLFGGGPRTRLLHPWFGLLFVIFFFFQFLNWFGPMAWTTADRRWLKHLKEYTTHQQRTTAREPGFQTVTLRHISQAHALSSAKLDMRVVSRPTGTPGTLSAGYRLTRLIAPEPSGR